jgi:hypothetical protein
MAARLTAGTCWTVWGSTRLLGAASSLALGIWGVVVRTRLGLGGDGSVGVSARAASLGGGAGATGVGMGARAGSGAMGVGMAARAGLMSGSAPTVGSSQASSSPEAATSLEGRRAGAVWPLRVEGGASPVGSFLGASGSTRTSAPMAWRVWM